MGRGCKPARPVARRGAPLLAGCEVGKAWFHFGAVPVFAEVGIHDSMGGVWEWAPRGLVIPVQTDGFGLMDAIARSGCPHESAQREPPRGVERGPASFLSP